jgi:hypothetical protein
MSREQSALVKYPNQKTTLGLYSTMSERPTERQRVRILEIKINRVRERLT